MTTEQQLAGNRGNRINGLFAAFSRDLTPDTVRQTARVLYLPVLHDPGVTKRCEGVLSPAELQRADRYASSDGKARFKQRRAFRRFCGNLALGSPRPLSDIHFEETENGRPYLSGLPNTWFSFSSCRFGFLAAWSSTHGIGVDLEDPTRELEAAELARQFFSPAEARAVESQGGHGGLRAFFRFWSLKEAALKSIGKGLPHGLDAFEFQLDPVPRLVRVPPGHGGPGRFNAHLIGGTGGCAALVIRRPGR